MITTSTTYARHPAAAAKKDLANPSEVAPQVRPCVKTSVYGGEEALATPFVRARPGGAAAKKDLANPSEVAPQVRPCVKTSVYGGEEMSAMSMANAYRIALALVSSYCLPAAERIRAARIIVVAMMDTPGPRRQAAAHRAARRLLAAHLGVPSRSLPTEPGCCQAVGTYEAARTGHADEDELPAFDRHSMLFAIENGVCPRCSRAGEFGYTHGQCACGFEYGDRETVDERGRRRCVGTTIPRPVAVPLLARW